MDPSRSTKGFFTNVRYMFDLRDVVLDVGAVVEDHVTSATRTVVNVGTGRAGLVRLSGWGLA
jgi:hypothetical protein